MAEKDEKMTLEKLAEMMGRGFNETSEKFKSLEIDISLIGDDVRDVKQRISRLEEKVGDLVATLDAFLKRLTDREEEFTIMKRELGIMKAVFKEKLNVDIDALK